MMLVQTLESPALWTAKDPMPTLVESPNAMKGMQFLQSIHPSRTTYPLPQYEYWLYFRQPTYRVVDANPIRKIPSHSAAD